MEPYILDYYNEMPYCVNVIDKMNEELAEAQDRIKELELQLKKEKIKSAKLKPLEKPCCIENEECQLDQFEEDIRNKFLEVCSNNFANFEKLSRKLKTDYTQYYNPLYEDSLIKYIINKLNEYTYYLNPEWCEFFVLTTIESYGINENYSFHGVPSLSVRSLITSLCKCEYTLISLQDLEY